MNQQETTATPNPFIIRPARESDIAALMAMIRELAEYERLADAVVASEADLHRALFGDSPAAEAIIAESAGGAAGFALFFRTYSTFVGRPGLWLEDLFVRPAFRRCGIGRALFQRLVALAAERDYGRMEWSVLDWNEPAIQFYLSLGAKPNDEWTTYRMTPGAFGRLANGNVPGET